MFRGAPAQTCLAKKQASAERVMVGMSFEGVLFQVCFRSLPELMDFGLFGKTFLVVKKEFRLFVGPSTLEVSLKGHQWTLDFV